MPQPFSILNRHGDSIFADFRYPEVQSKVPVVILVHGIKGFKDWGFWRPLAERLAQNGIASVAFNFSHNGIGNTDWGEFTRLDLFRKNTFSLELDDLDAILESITSGRIGRDIVDVQRIGILGHSRGGGISIIKTSEDVRVKSLVTWNAVGDFFARFTPQQIADWQSKGYTEIRNDRTGQMMQMDRILYDDALAHRERLDLRLSASRILAPWLIVHATDDNVVPFSENAMTLFNHSSPKTRLFEAKDQHAFGASQPQNMPLPDSLEAVIQQSVQFLKASL
jgi:alpha-beta hydrolase superfamily lysophospholipase